MLYRSVFVLKRCSLLFGYSCRPYSHGDYGISTVKKGNRITFEDKRLVGFTPEQLFEVVYRVQEYPLFVPWCKDAVIRNASERSFEAELFIGFPPVKEHYISRVTSIHPNVVRSACTDGRLFRVFDTMWRFGPSPPGSPAQSCVLHFTLDFEFRSSFYAHFTNLFFGQIAKTMVTAFLKRAEFVYGKPSFVQKP